MLWIEEAMAIHESLRKSNKRLEMSTTERFHNFKHGDPQIEKGLTTCSRNVGLKQLFSGTDLQGAQGARTPLIFLKEIIYI